MSGRFYRNAEEMFAEISWVRVMVGQGVLPQGYHPLVDQVPDRDTEGLLASVAQTIGHCVEVMPTHQQFIDRYWKAAAVH